MGNEVQCDFFKVRFTTAKTIFVEKFEQNQYAKVDDEPNSLKVHHPLGILNL